MRCLIGSGYVSGEGREQFAELWRVNFTNYYPANDYAVSRIAIVANGDANRPLATIGYRVEWIDLQGNNGHIGDLINGRKDRDYCGWTSAVCALAMLAYSDESDFVYREQDCLCFGPWLEQLYTDMGDGMMAFGGKMLTEPYMECAQSLFIVRHRFIPEFVAHMLVSGDERRKDEEGKEDNLPERKFHRLREKHPEIVKALSFGVDRERPLPYDSPVWYAQKFTDEELEELRKRGMI